MQQCIILKAIMQDNLSQKELLDLLLHNAQLTRAELARVAGVLPNQVSRWNGRAPLPKIIIEYLELKAKYLRLLDKI